MSICPSSFGPSNIQKYKIHNTLVIMNKVIIYIQHNQKRVFKTCICTAVQKQNAASTYYTSKQILPLVSAEQCKLCTSNNDNIYKQNCVTMLNNICYIVSANNLILSIFIFF